MVLSYGFTALLISHHPICVWAAFWNNLNFTYQQHREKKRQKNCYFGEELNPDICIDVLLVNVKGSFVSFQLVPVTPGSDFPPPNNPKFDEIKKLKFSYNKDLCFLILSNFGLLEGGKSEPGVSGTN